MWAQCKKIVVEAVDVNQHGFGCNYSLTIHAHENGGNPSIKPFYQCGTGLKTALPCIDLLTDSVHYTPQFSCHCDVPVYIYIVGYASENCRGDTCNAYTSRNLAIDVKETQKQEDRGIIFIPHERRFILPEKFTHITIYSPLGVVIYKQMVNGSAIIPPTPIGVYYAKISTPYYSQIKTIIL